MCRSERNMEKNSVFQPVLHLAFIINISVIFFSVLTSSKPLVQRVCKSEECIAAASNLKLWMNVSADPCDDFYQYACGNYKLGSPYSRTSNLETTLDKNYEDIKEFLLKKNNDDEPEAVHKARKLFNMCLNMDIRKEQLKHLKIPSLTSTDHEYVDEFFVSRTNTFPCLKLIKSKFHLAISYMYAQEKYRNARSEVIEMLKYTRENFFKIIEEVTWMDTRTKRRALQKLTSMGQYIPYPDINELPELSEALDELYQIDIDENENPLEIMSTLQEILNFNREKAREEHNNPFKEDHVFSSITNFDGFSSFYNVEMNFLSISAVDMMPPLFGNDIKALNFGGLGWTIGHEMMHAFDPEARAYNEWGIKENWWSEMSLQIYNRKIKCYNITKKENDEPTISTVDEDFADNGAYNLALLAYRRYVSERGVEPLLVHFENFAHEQLLTLEFANIFCAHPLSDAYMKGSTGLHSPYETRVNGVLRNSNAFAKIWKCPRGSGMNPSAKCSFW